MHTFIFKNEDEVHYYFYMKNIYTIYLFLKKFDNMFPYVLESVRLYVQPSDPKREDTVSGNIEFARKSQFSELIMNLYTVFRESRFTKDEGAHLF